MAVAGTAGGRIAPGVGANLIGMHAQDRNQDATIYVGNLDPQMSEELVWELFTQAGPVAESITLEKWSNLTLGMNVSEHGYVNVYLPKDRVTNAHQGYGFIEFRAEEDADYAIKILNMIKLFGKPIRVNKASQDKRTQDVGANIFIGNLDPDVDEKLLYDTFNAFGVIIATPKIMRDPETGASKGYGFVSYDCFEASDSAIEALNGQFYNNRPINVSYAFKKDTRGERHGTPAERQLAAQQRAKVMQQNRPHTLFATAPRQKPQHIEDNKRQQEEEQDDKEDKDMVDADNVEAPPAPPPPPPPSGGIQPGQKFQGIQPGLRPPSQSSGIQPGAPTPPGPPGPPGLPQGIQPQQYAQQQQRLPGIQPPQQRPPLQPPHQQQQPQIGQQGLQISFQAPQGPKVNPQRPLMQQLPRPPIQPQQQGPPAMPRPPQLAQLQQQQRPPQQGPPQLPRPPQLPQVPQIPQRAPGQLHRGPPRPPGVVGQRGPPRPPGLPGPPGIGGPRPPVQQGGYRGPPGLPPPPRLMGQGGPPPPGFRPPMGYGPPRQQQGQPRGPPGIRPPFQYQPRQ